MYNTKARDKDNFLVSKERKKIKKPKAQKEQQSEWKGRRRQDCLQRSFHCLTLHFLIKGNMFLEGNLLQKENKESEIFYPKKKKKLNFLLYRTKN